MSHRPALSSFALCVLAGCSFQASCGAKKLDMKKAKEFVSTKLAEDVGEKPANVICPESVKIEKGKTFECTADFGAAKATVVMSQEDDEGFVKITSVTGILIGKKAEAAIAERLGKQFNAHFTVDCGAPVRAATAGDRFTCSAKDAAGKGGPVTVTVKDASGNVRFDLGAPGGAPAQEAAPAEQPGTEQAPAPQ
jgi:hypothetical protein